MGPPVKWNGTYIGQKVPARGSKLARQYPFVAKRDLIVVGAKSHTTALRDAVLIARRFGRSAVLQVNQRVGARVIATCDIRDDKRRVVECHLDKKPKKPTKRRR